MKKSGGTKEASHQSGFSLVELMVAVAIVAIIAIVAIPNYLRYLEKSKQTEVKLNLNAILTAERAYYNDRTRFTPLISDIGWAPVGVCVYRYSVGGDFAGNPNPGGSPMNNDPPGADLNSFTAVAWGNIDLDATMDTWNISSAYQLKNTEDDLWN